MSLRGSIFGGSGMARQVRILETGVVADFGFLNVTRTKYTYTLPRGQKTPTGQDPEQTRLIIDRKDSAAAIVYQPATGLLYFVKQFRYATYSAADEPAPENGWLVELVAGVVERTETSRESIVREIKEELGFSGVSNLELIGKFYLSPGAASESLYLFCVEVDEGDLDRPEGGRGDPDEWVDVISMSASEFLRKVEQMEIFDAKTIAAAEYIRRTPGRFAVDI